MQPSFVDGIGSRTVLPSMYDRATQLGIASLVAPVTDVAAALRLLLDRNHVLAEGAGATPVACALAAGFGPDDVVVCVVSGGVIGLERCAIVAVVALEGAGRLSHSDGRAFRSVVRKPPRTPFPAGSSPVPRRRRFRAVAAPALARRVMGFAGGRDRQGGRDAGASWGDPLGWTIRVAAATLIVHCGGSWRDWRRAGAGRGRGGG